MPRKEWERYSVGEVLRDMGMELDPLKKMEQDKRPVQQMNKWPDPGRREGKVRRGRGQGKG